MTLALKREMGTGRALLQNLKQAAVGPITELSSLFLVEMVLSGIAWVTLSLS